MKEGEAWHSIYRNAALKTRRQRKHWKKYDKYQLPKELSNALILDLCCGSGEFAVKAATENPSSTVVGIDLRPEFKVLAHVRNLFFIKSNAIELPVKSGTVSQLFIMHSLHHLGQIAELKILLQELRRIMVIGGVLHLIDHYPSWQLKLAFTSLKSPIARLLPWTRCFGMQLKEENQIVNYWLNNYSSFFPLLNNASFERLIFRKELFFFYACYKVRQIQ
ncbi:class I SAM-dependent methyltransferase [bacterium]|nr:class I SAM-dependent methyltransferase [bacterium]